jgi:hypothetical protein
MCKAFSCIVTEDCHARWKFGVDGHEDIVQAFGLKDDGVSFARVEIAPANGLYLTPDEWVFKIDEQSKPKWWNPAHEAEARGAWTDWKKRLDKILIYKPIIHPFRDIAPPKKITKKHLAQLKQWASVRASVWASVWDSVGDGVWASVRASVRDGVWDSVWDSVGASVRDSVGAYTGTFFKLPLKSWLYTENIKAKGYPFQPAADLWGMGLIPSFDGKKWRLHGGPKGKVLWEGEL